MEGISDLLKNNFSAFMTESVVMSTVWAIEECIYIYVHSNISAAVNWLTNTTLYN
jgi:hypothetical protein